MAKQLFIIAMVIFIAGIQGVIANPNLRASLAVFSSSIATSRTTADSGPETARSPSPFAARYSAFWNKKGLGSKAIYRLSRLEHHHYLLQFTLSVPFIRAVEFAWHEHRPQPLFYRKVRRTLSRKHIEEAYFNWDTKTVHWRKDDDQGTLTLAPNTLDKLSLQFTLACQLPQRQGEHLHFNIFDGKRIKPYIFQRLEEETLSLPIGTVHTVKVKRLREEENNYRETFLWLAPGYHYMVVRMRQVEGSNNAEIKLKQIDLAPSHHPCEERS